MTLKLRDLAFLGSLTSMPTWDACIDFHASLGPSQTNPNGRWTYGQKDSNLVFSQVGTSLANGWGSNGVANTPFFLYGESDGARPIIVSHPGIGNGREPTLRWTAPAAMTISIDVRITKTEPSGDGVRFRLRTTNNAQIDMSGVINGPTGLYTYFNPSYTVSAGQVLDFDVDRVGSDSGDTFLYDRVIIRQVGGAPTDPSFANVSLLLSMNGANGSTTFIDSSPSARTVTRIGNTQISTAQSRFGGASALFDGSGDLLTVPDNVALEMTGDFTIECFAYPTLATDRIIAGHSAGGASQNVQLFRINSGAAGNLAFFLNGTQVFANTAAGITINQWFHLAICRSGSTTRMFVNGIQIGASNTTWTGAFKFNAIGGMFGLDFQGHIDEFRVTKGVARYTANFTPPTSAFPTS